LVTFALHFDDFIYPFWYVVGCRGISRKFISVHLFYHFWDNGTPCFETPMTPLSDTHARARKLKDVIDQCVRARISKKNRASRSPIKQGFWVVSPFLDRFCPQKCHQKRPKRQLNGAPKHVVPKSFWKRGCFHFGSSEITKTGFRVEGLLKLTCAPFSHFSPE